MKLKINFERLNDIMQAFYALTGIKIIIFDINRNIVHSYPDKDCAFCEKMKAFSHTAKKCFADDIRIFNECKKEGRLILYTCHAGLVEGCAPLKQNGEVLGYIMFGQISDLSTRETLMQNVIDVCKADKLDEKAFLSISKSIKLKSYDDIMASAKIFEACISYILLNEMLTAESDKTILECEKYMESHLDTVSVEGLCHYMKISRTALYNIFQEKTGQGVAAFIRNKRLESAKKMLSETDLSISEISARCGFSDYNYFSRVFKKKYGYSARLQKSSRAYT